MIMFPWPKSDLDKWILSCDGFLTPHRGSRFSKYATCFVDWAEALHSGLMPVCDRNIEELLVHMDLKEAVMIAKDSFHCLWKILILVSKIKTIMGAFQRCRITCVV